MIAVYYVIVGKLGTAGKSVCVSNSENAPLKLFTWEELQDQKIIAKIQCYREANENDVELWYRWKAGIE